MCFILIYEQHPYRHPKRAYKNTCQVVFKTSTQQPGLSWTVLKILKWHHLSKHRVTFSSYKHHNTAKGIIGIAPNRAIIFMSKLLWQNCYSVTADRGFDISEDLPESVELTTPPFTRGKNQLIVEEETRTRRIALFEYMLSLQLKELKTTEYYKEGFQLTWLLNWTKFGLLAILLTFYHL